MGGVGVKHGPAQIGTKGRRRAWVWVGIAVAVTIAALVLLLRPDALRYWLEPRFQVTGIDAAERTMTLRRANHRYVVRCDDYCSSFRVGESYFLTMAGDHLRGRSSNQEISLPILQEEVDFTTTGGHG